MRENIHNVGRQQNACFLFEELCTPSAQELVINCKYVITFSISLCSHPFLFPTKIDYHRCGLEIPVVSDILFKRSNTFFYSCSLRQETTEELSEIILFPFL